ncbi:DUF2188 domain-containing protein [Pseudomonas sp. LRF_L74]|uniref:DUF2188 domain-containing protein n=1 Tax=Pseudomonas sp. LRF_L74 TaxID=3369422 RepID=UPI003F5DAD43
MGIYHIRQTDAGWELIKQGATRASKRALTKGRILKEAQRFLSGKDALLVLHHEDGSSEQVNYPQGKS